MKVAWPLLLAVSCLCAAIQPTVAGDPPKAGVLDGKSFKGQLVRAGESAGDSDTLVFADGLFRTATGAGFGFKETHYYGVQLGATTTFRVELSSETHGKMWWSGRVRGETIEANVKWAEPGKEPAILTFKGTAEPKPPSGG